MNPVSFKTCIHKATPQCGNKEVLVVRDMKYPTKTALPLLSVEEESSTLARTTLAVGLVCTPVAGGTVHEYIFNDQDGSWSDGFVFTNSDGFGGASTYSIMSNAFFFALGSDQTMELWWQNYNSSSSKTDNSWHLGPSSHNPVSQNATCARSISSHIKALVG